MFKVQNQIVALTQFGLNETETAMMHPLLIITLLNDIVIYLL